MKTMCAFAALAGVVSCAAADYHQWDFSRGMPGSYGINDAGGRIESIRTTFDPSSQDFSFSVNFSNSITQGFWLAISPGANPKGHAGELALMYFDARISGDARLTIYNYNGENGASSYRDGSPLSGTQTPDRVLTSLSPSFAPALSVAESSGGRSFSIAFNAAAVNGHNPLYPAAGGNDWTGLAFGEQLGIWFHPVANLSSSYNNDGWLTNFGGTQGWIDGNGFTTTLVPAPGSLALVGLAGLCAARRRR
jgi:hypothetical protein